MSIIERKNTLTAIRALLCAAFCVHLFSCTKIADDDVPTTAKKDPATMTAVFARAPVLSSRNKETKTGDTLTCSLSISELEAFKIRDADIITTFQFYNLNQGTEPKAIVTTTDALTKSATYSLIASDTDTASRTDIQEAFFQKLDSAGDDLACSVSFTVDGSTTQSPQSNSIELANTEPTLSCDNKAQIATIDKPLLETVLCIAKDKDGTPLTFKVEGCRGLTIDEQGTIGGAVNSSNCAPVVTVSDGESEVSDTLEISFAPTASVGGAPVGISNATQATLLISGTDAAQYRFSLLDNGESDCSTAAFGMSQDINTPLNLDLSTTPDGLLTVCVITGDSNGNWQWEKLATTAQWTKDTSAPNAIELSNKPSNPSSATSLNVTVSGTDIAEYQYAVILSGTCANATYSPWRQISSPIASFLFEDGNLTLCVRARDSASNLTTTEYAWTKHSTPPAIQSFVLKDVTTSSTNNTNDTTVIANVTADSSATKLCVQATSTTPTASDACWQSTFQQNATVASSSTTMLYAWVKNSDELISAMASASISHSVFPEFAGISNASNTNQGGKHLTLSWASVTTPDTFDHYNIYMTTTSGSYSYSTPSYVITPASVTSVTIGGLNDGTQYCFVVRAAAGTTIESTNTVEQCATTLNAVSFSLPVNFNDPVFTTLNSYLNFSLNTVSKLEVATYSGKSNSGYLKGQYSTLALTHLFNNLGAVHVNSAGDLIAADESGISRINTNGTFTTVAGNSIAGYAGDGLQGTSASLDHPQDFAWDSSGNMYVADTNNQRIRKLATNGVITTIAGDGTAGFSGDSGAASSAELNAPSALVIDVNDIIYVADKGNNRVRKIDINGTITTYAGTGSPGFNGDGGAATSANLTSPTSLAIDGDGGLLIGESARVRKVSTAGIISTLAGTGTTGYSGDNGAATSANIGAISAIAVDSTGKIYITDSENHVCRQIDISGTITTIAGDGSAGTTGDLGQATAAKMRSPSGVTLDSAGNLYIAEGGGGRIRRVDTSGVITTFAGSGQSANSSSLASVLAGTSNVIEYASPTGLQASGSSLYIADTLNNRIAKVDSAGNVTTVVGTGTAGNTGDDAAATSALLNSPKDVAIDSNGNLYIADTNNHRVRKVSTDSTIRAFAGDGTSGQSGNGGPATSAKLYSPTSIAVNSLGEVFISDTQGNSIRKVQTDGNIVAFAGVGTAGFSGDSQSATTAELNAPRGIAIDASGNVYICDSGNARIRKVSTDGIISTVAGNGSFTYGGDSGNATSASLHMPVAIDVDTQGNLYILESIDSTHQQSVNAIRKVTSTGIISTLVGGLSQNGFSGDGASGTEVLMSQPQGLTLDSTGNLYYSDTGNHRIRVLKTGWE